MQLTAGEDPANAKNRTKECSTCYWAEMTMVYVAEVNGTGVGVVLNRTQSADSTS